MAGDGLQNGGLLIVSKGGVQVLLNHKEDNPGDHVSNAIILRVLGISEYVEILCVCVSACCSSVHCYVSVG